MEKKKDQKGEEKEGKSKKVYVVATHEVTSQEFDFEKGNIVSLEKENTKIKMNFENIYYPLFPYDKYSLTEEEAKKPPYAECFVTQIDETGHYLACGYSNGFVNIFCLNEKKKPVIFRPSENPITSLKWNKKNPTTLIVVSSDGQISHWHSTSGKILHSMKEKDNSINSVDYSRDYKKFATGGNDVCVRVYDESMKTLTAEMRPYKFDQPGHSSRIFCVKFNPENMNMIISGGWDKTIQFYDVREGKIVNSIYGPHICGEALDISGFNILSGSWSTEKQIQIWDFRTMKCLNDVKWENNSPYYPTYIYSTKFNTMRDYRTFGVGAVNKHLWRIFDIDKYSSSTPDENPPSPLFGSECASACYSIDYFKLSQKREMFACGCGDGGARVYTIETV